MHGPPKPRTSIAFDLRQEPGAGKPHAGICAGGPGQPGPLPLQVARLGRASAFGDFSDYPPARTTAILLRIERMLSWWT